MFSGHTGNSLLKLNIATIATGFDNENSRVGPLGKTRGDDKTRKTTTDDNKVVRLVSDVGGVGRVSPLEEAACRESRGRSDSGKRKDSEHGKECASH